MRQRCAAHHIIRILHYAIIVPLIKYELSRSLASSSAPLTIAIIIATTIAIIIISLSPFSSTTRYQHLNNHPHHSFILTMTTTTITHQSSSIGQREDRASQQRCAHHEENCWQGCPAFPSFSSSPSRSPVPTLRLKTNKFSKDTKCLLF